ncbi:MAG: folate-binding protein [Bradyrhizobium sp.]
MKATFLEDRGVVQVSGDDARKFLNGLFTTDVTKLTPGEARFGALLTPQGKIIVDFLVAQTPSTEAGERFLLDCPRALAQALADKLNIYKLRAKVAIANLSDQFGVIAIWDGAMAPTPEPSFADPRHSGLGARVIAPQTELPAIAARLGAEIVGADAYETHRIDCSVPRGGLDFMYGDAFPHETNMDRLHGVDMGKGCYVGQEVVSRMHHRGITRTRAAQVLLDDASPEPGTPIMAGDKSIGTMGSASQQKGMALLRIDRVAEAIEAGTPLTAGGLTLRVADPDALQGAPKQTVA